MKKNGIWFTTVPTTASQVSFIANSGITDDASLSIMPFSWMSFRTLDTAAVECRIWMRQINGWSDPAVNFADNYNAQYMTFHVDLYNGPITFTGDIWGFAIIDDPVVSVVIQGGTGRAVW